MNAGSSPASGACLRLWQNAARADERRLPRRPGERAARVSVKSNTGEREPGLRSAPLVSRSRRARLAQVIQRGIQGGVTGAIIGGIIGGGKGAGRGAAIGAGVGVVAGAIEADQNAQRRAYYGPPATAIQSRLRHAVRAAAALATIRVRPTASMAERTAEAISAYQYSYRLPVNGQPSPQLLDHMIRHGG